MTLERIVTAGNVAFTGHGQILDTTTRNYWGRIIGRAPEIRSNCYRVVRLYDGRPDFPDLDSLNNLAYEVTGRDDVPNDTIVRLYRSNWGDFWTFLYSECAAENTGSLYFSGGGGCDQYCNCMATLTAQRKWKFIYNLFYFSTSEAKLRLVPDCDSYSVDVNQESARHGCLARLCVKRKKKYTPIHRLYYIDLNNNLVEVPDLFMPDLDEPNPCIKCLSGLHVSYDEFWEPFDYVEEIHYLYFFSESSYMRRTVPII